jgi:hypothetical protein
MFGFDVENDLIRHYLKTFGISGSHFFPVTLDIGFFKKVDQILLPFFPIFGLQKLLSDVMFVDFLKKGKA